MAYVKCRICGETYSETKKRCPKCGSEQKIIETICEPIKLIPSMKVEQVHGKNPHLPSRKKKRWEIIDRDTVQRGDGKTRIHHFQYKDRDLDIYEEVVSPTYAPVLACA